MAQLQATAERLLQLLKLWDILYIHVYMGEKNHIASEWLVHQHADAWLEEQDKITLCMHRTVNVL